jgi:2-oxoglutarate/2-oxoacid ferredoxin oxidoreductase subunit alpha
MATVLSDRSEHPKHPEVERFREVVIRFAGDSGDGMQLTGSQFTNTSALAGNDLSTLPDFPAEIRAPAGTMAGVSAFQVRIADHDIHTPGDQPDVLVAMNPAALKTNLADLQGPGVLIVNVDDFSERNLKKAGYEANPLDRRLALRLPGLPSVEHDHPDPPRPRGPRRSTSKSKDRSRTSSPWGWCTGCLSGRWSRRSALAGAQVRQEAGARRGQRQGAQGRLLLRRDHRGLPGPLRGGAGAPGARHLPQRHSATGARPRPGRRLAAGAACRSSSAAYPITPASDILHELSTLKHFGVATFQAEDEIAAVGAAIGASFGGALG